MKRMIAFACLAFALVSFAQAQSLDKILKALQADSGTQHQAIDKQTLRMMNQLDSTAQKKIPSFMQRIEKIDVFTLEKVQKKNIDKFLEEIKAYKDDEHHETMLAVNEQDRLVKIITHKDGDAISDVNIVVGDPKSVVFVRLEGKLSMKDLQSIVDEQKANLEKK